MNCFERDRKLVLLATGESPLGEALATQLHLMTCPGCRAHYTAVRKTVARFAPRTGWRRLFALRIGRAPVFIRALTLGSLTVAVLAVMAHFLTIIRHSPAHPAASSPSAATAESHRSADKGCLPGLPNDHCR